MKISYLKGLSFGLTSGIITTLGMMVGLHAGTHSKLAVMGGVLTIAVADAFSDALGVHISEESEGRHTEREIWESTFSTFIAKFVFALTFMVPILTLNLSTAILVGIIWGLMWLAGISYFMSLDQKTPAWRTISEHIGIALLVIFITHYVGDMIAKYFGPPI